MGAEINWEHQETANNLIIPLFALIKKGLLV